MDTNETVSLRKIGMLARRSTPVERYNLLKRYETEEGQDRVWRMGCYILQDWGVCKALGIDYASPDRNLVDYTAALLLEQGIADRDALYALFPRPETLKPPQ